MRPNRVRVATLLENLYLELAEGKQYGHRGWHNGAELRRQDGDGGVGVGRRPLRWWAASSGEMLRREPGPEGAALRRVAVRARGACHRQADGDDPVRHPPAAVHPRAGPRQVHALTGAHISAGCAVRDVLLQPDHGHQLGEVALQLGLLCQDALLPHPA